MNFWKKACFRPVIIMLRKVGDGQVVHLVVRLMRECPGLVMVHPHRHRLALDKHSMQQDVGEIRLPNHSGDSRTTANSFAKQT